MLVFYSIILVDETRCVVTGLENLRDALVFKGFRLSRIKISNVEYKFSKSRNKDEKL